jgi:hypothetical protein
MHEFGSTGLVTGFIKQLLASFELPTTRVYTKEFENYFQEHGKESPFVLESYDGIDSIVPKLREGTYDTLSRAKSLLVDEKLMVPYLKDGRVRFYLGGYYTSDNEFKPGKWQSNDLDVNELSGGVWNIYNRGSAYLNHTKRLQIRNNIYDSYTHEYLGNYLRFLRDYDNLDLMSLYNCFSNRLSPSNLNIAVSTEEGTDNVSQFNALDDNYKIYLVPVKLFKKYTIAIDSAAPVEMCCGIYNNKINLLKPEYSRLISTTYFKQTKTFFGQPFVYNALVDLAPKELNHFPTSKELEEHSDARRFLARIADKEANLTLFLKVHKDVDSSIVILEGDYTGWNDFSASLTYSTTPTSRGALPEKRMQIKYNHTVLANEAIFSEEAFSLISPLQLLRFNTKKQIPFSDRLLEYLLDMCITGSEDEPRENVLMAQYLMGLRHKGKIASTSYYVVKNGDLVEDIVYLNRSFCVNTGDYYLKTTIADSTGNSELVVYRYNAEAGDTRIGNLREFYANDALFFQELEGCLRKKISECNLCRIKKYLIKKWCDYLNEVYVHLK